MDLKRNDSVMHVVFLHHRTGLIVTASAVLGLRDRIPFAFMVYSVYLFLGVVAWL